MSILLPLGSIYIHVECFSNLQILTAIPIDEYVQVCMFEHLFYATHSFPLISTHFHSFPLGSASSTIASNNRRRDRTCYSFLVEKREYNIFAGSLRNNYSNVCLLRTGIDIHELHCSNIGHVDDRSSLDVLCREKELRSF